MGFAGYGFEEGRTARTGRTKYNKHLSGFDYPIETSKYFDFPPSGSKMLAY